MRHSILCTVLLFAAISCARIDDNFMYVGVKKGSGSTSTTPNAERTAQNETRRIMLLYSLGVNNLRNSLLEDIDDLTSSWLPGMNRQENMLLVFSHSGVSGTNFKTPSEPVLFSVSKGYDGEIVRDTLKAWAADKIGSSAEMLNEVLTYIHDNYISASCGIVFTSHASGWLPDNYYDNLSRTDKGYSISTAEQGTLTETHTGNYIDTPAGVQTDTQLETQSEQTSDIEGTRRNVVKKSFGVQVGPENMNYEINIDELAAAIPFKMDYIIFDACLMAGVEVAYELKDVCRYFVASPTEILADGFDYVNMAGRLLSGKEADVLGVCEDYYNHYVQRNSYATISCIDCSQLEPLAEACQKIFATEGRRDILKALSTTDIQRYYRGRYHWFYDLKSVLDKLELSADEEAELDKALEKAVVYNEATSRFLDIQIKEHCGLSTYLQNNGTKYLDTWYQRLKWNQRTGYVTILPEEDHGQDSPESSAL